MENKTRTADQGKVKRKKLKFKRNKGKVESKGLSEVGEKVYPPLYRRWLILAATVIGMGIVGYTIVNSYKADVEESMQQELIIDGTEIPVENLELSESSGTEEEAYSGGMIGPRQWMILLAFPVLIGGILPSVIASGDIYSGRFEDGSRFFWIVTVWLLATVGVVAYLVIGRKVRKPRLARQGSKK